MYRDGMAKSICRQVRNDIKGSIQSLIIPTSFFTLLFSVE